MQKELGISKTNLKVDFEPIVLSESKFTRLVLCPEKFPDSGLRLEFIHQRKMKAFGTEQWEKDNHFNKRQLQGGECVGLELGTKETAILLENLPFLKEAAEIDYEHGYSKVAKLDPDEEIVSSGTVEELQSFKKLLDEKAPVEVKLILDQVIPEETLARLSELKALDAKREALSIFKEQLDAKAWNEKQWQSFFETHQWIFGYGINFCYLEHIRREGYCGGKDDSGTGGQQVDFMMASRLENAKFSVLVEIKTPHTRLLQGDSQIEHRNKVYTLHKDFISSVSQIQHYCDRWEREGSLYHESVKKYLKDNTYTYRPKGILIIGHTNELAGEENKFATLELFRRGLHNLDILTYDELYERAKYITQQTTVDLQESTLGSR